MWDLTDLKPNSILTVFLYLWLFLSVLFLYHVMRFCVCPLHTANKQRSGKKEKWNEENFIYYMNYISYQSVSYIFMEFEAKVSLFSLHIVCELLTKYVEIHVYCVQKLFNYFHKLTEAIIERKCSIQINIYMHIQHNSFARSFTSVVVYLFLFSFFGHT